MDQRRPYRSFVSYIDRSREYYAAQGYDKPYTWPHYDNVPFTPLRKPLSGCRVGLPGEAEIQSSIVGIALDLLERAWMPRTTIQTHYYWDGDEWREAFMRVDAGNRGALAREGQARRELQAKVKTIK